MLSLDGERSRPAVVRELAALVEGGQLTIQQDGAKVMEPRRVEPLLLQALEQRLEQFAGHALLLA